MECRERNISVACRERVVPVQDVCSAKLLTALVEMGKNMKSKTLKKDLTDPWLATEVHYLI